MSFFLPKWIVWDESVLFCNVYHLTYARRILRGSGQIVDGDKGVIYTHKDVTYSIANGCIPPSLQKEENGCIPTHWKCCLFLFQLQSVLSLCCFWSPISYRRFLFLASPCYFLDVIINNWKWLFFFFFWNELEMAVYLSSFWVSLPSLSRMESSFLYFIKIIGTFWCS